MQDPIKLIYKYKNNNSRIQYQTYIFIGDIVPNNIMNILKKIEDLSLYETLIELTDNEYKLIDKYYGKEWYKNFFNTRHINKTINQIKKTNTQQDELIKKYGKDWYNEHINKFVVVDKKIFYSYDSIIKDEILRKEIKKKNIIVEEEEDIDYTTRQKEYVDTRIKDELSENVDSDILSTSTNISESESESTEKDLIDKFADYEPINTEESSIDINSNDLSDDLSDEELNQEGGDDEEYEEIEQQEVLDENENGEIDFDEGLNIEERLVDEELDLEDLDKIYQDNDVTELDKNINQTTTLIKDAIKNDKLFNKIVEQLVDFDTSKDDLINDEQLKNVWTKKYITNQYIFKDDTVKLLKNKICCSIKNNPKFGDDLFIIPSRQYLWSEYYFNNKLEKIMIGQKWIKRTELLQIDIEPNNNIFMYEELRGNLKILKDNIKRYGSKIKREDDDFNILYDYEGYITNNEIFMIDIYNELGKGYNPDPELLKNVIDVYIRVYFPRIKIDDVQYIIDYLNGNTKVEGNKIRNIYETLNADLLIENQVVKDIETIKRDKLNYEKYFNENYITQSTIHLNLRLVKEDTKIDLFRIFNEFIVTSEYPFVQYQTIDGQIIFKYNEEDIVKYSSKKENIEVLQKWFENSPYGISFKVKTNEDKFMAINLNDLGRIEYKTQWKETDNATIKDIKGTYDYVRKLLRRLNEDKNNFKVHIPEDFEFKYAFINTIQKFELPENYTINHNDLSEFSRYFFPYVALVIEPRKRQSKTKQDTGKSKYGTYLRYKKVSKYENQTRIEQRIIYFMRNYDYNEQSLSNEISKQFNITIDRALEEIERVKNKYPGLKKSRKMLKVLENIPKYKPPGIGVDIQGKQRDKYKIRVSGARDKEQLDRIINFINILIYLYIETYLYKRPEKQILKEKLKKLTGIARRRNKVDDVVNYDREVKTIKQMAILDKKRIGFKAAKGQNQYSRLCQHSGDDKKRQPQHYTSLDNLLAEGFKLNKKTNVYEKQYEIKGKGGKKKYITIKAVALDAGDEKGSMIYYACNPKDNGEHMYIGFLSRSNNPYGACMPCCFKKDQSTSKNKQKQEYFLKCIGQIKEKVEVDTINKVVGDQLYILQDTNKIQEGRIGTLPKHIDIYFNQFLNKTRKIKLHYLLQTKTGYYFKYGTIQTYPFLNAVGGCLDMTIDTIKDKLIDKLNKDKNDVLFTAINNGDIKTRFITKEKFIEYIKTSEQLSFDLLNHLISIPNILVDHGLNIIVFKRINIVIKKTLEKEKIKDEFVIECQNKEELDNINDPKRTTIFLIKELDNYYPIVLVKKLNELDKNIDIKKTFKYDDEEKIVNHVKDFYIQNCKSDIIEELTNKENKIAKEVYKILMNIDNKEFNPRYQIIDARNKCKYIILNNSLIIPTKPSGSIYNLSITKIIKDKLLSVEDTFDKINILKKIVKDKLPINPIGIFYSSKNNNNTVNIISIMTESYDSIPVIEKQLDIEWINKKGLVMENKPLYDKIDEEIIKGKQYNKIDDRIKNVNYNNFYNESYELFRYELSDYINDENNINFRNKLERIINNKELKKKEKKINIMELLYKIIDRDLLERFIKIVKQSGGKYDRFIYISSKLPDLSNYSINNNRELCKDLKQNECSLNPHCKYIYDKCYFTITKDIIIDFINKVAEELASNEIKGWEILRKDKYYVSDIVDYNRYTSRPGQIIVKSSNTAMSKILTDLLGKDNVPKIGRRKALMQDEINFYELNALNPLKNMGEFFIQNILDNNLTIYRAFANGYNWIKHKYYSLEGRNLGYYSDLQTDLANYFRSLVIDWLSDKHNVKYIEKDLLKYMEVIKNKDIVTEFINRISKDVLTVTNGVVEYYILNKIVKIPIIIYNNLNEIMYIFDNGIVYDYNKNNDVDLLEKYKKDNVLNTTINIRYINTVGNDIPLNIEVILVK